MTLKESFEQYRSLLKQKTDIVKFLEARKRRDNWQLDIKAYRVMVDTGIDKLPGVSARTKRLIQGAKRKLKNAREARRRAQKDMNKYWAAMS